jgi:hypothetical protein
MSNGFQSEGGGALESGQHESYESFEAFGGGSQESEVYGEQSGEGPFNETQEMALAAELLSVSNEQELEQFLGGLIKSAGQAVGSFVRSPVGQALGGVLKDAVRQALPIVGGAIGSYVGGPTGGDIGRNLASTAGRVFGLELEGLSGEDQEFEVARRFVRFAGASAGRAAMAPRNMPPRQAARAAVAGAARRFAPGLLRGRPSTQGFRGRRGGYGGVNIQNTAGADQGAGDTGDVWDDGMADAGGSETPGTPGAAGRWMRRGRQIIVFNC